MARGPAPTPTKILEMRGSDLARGRQGEVQFEPGRPVRPSFLKGEARAEWDRQVKQLDDAGILQKVDRAMLAAYCEAWGEFVSLRERIDELIKADPRTGYDRAIATGLLKAKNTTAQRLARLAQEFGFSAASRTRVKADAPKSEPKVMSRKRG